MKIGEHEVKILSKTELMVGCQKVGKDELEILLAELEKYQPSVEFKVGDFVQVVIQEEIKGITDGLYGKIAQKQIHNKFGKIITKMQTVEYRGCYGVEFSEKMYSLHDCCEKTKWGHGFWVRSTDLVLQI